MKISRTDHQTVQHLLNDLSHIQTELSTDGLMVGNSGLLLFFNTLEKFSSSKRSRDCSEQISDGLISRFASEPRNFSFAYGFHGVNWSLRSAGLNVKDLSFNQVKITQQVLESRSWYGQYDLFKGLCGFAINTIDAFIASEIDDTLPNEILNLICLTSTNYSVGLSWHNPLVFNHENEAIQGHFNLGLAHGIPSIWVVLSRFYKAGINPNLCRSIFYESLNWFFNLASRYKNSIPYSYSFSQKSENSRQAWCYGDPGVGIAMLIAAQAFEFSFAEEYAIQILLRSAENADINCGVYDASLCHGSAGLALMYKLAFQLSGEKALSGASEKWFKASLGYRLKRNAGVFQARQHNSKTNKYEMAKNNSLLTGNIGVGLGLMACLDSSCRSWSRSLLIS
jgi:lantibiotic biosynthesis protein